MNVYTGLLFLQGHVADPTLFADDAGYGQPTYGNRVANERVLRESWERSAAIDTDAEAGDTGEAKAA